MPRINIELPAAWDTPSSVMTDISNNRLSLYILHEPAPQSMALCCTFLVSFDGWKLKTIRSPWPRIVSRLEHWVSRWISVGTCMQTLRLTQQLRSNGRHVSHILPKSQLSVLSVVCVCVCVCVFFLNNNLFSNMLRYTVTLHVPVCLFMAK